MDKSSGYIICNLYPDIDLNKYKFIFCYKRYLMIHSFIRMQILSFLEFEMHICMNSLPVFIIRTILCRKRDTISESNELKFFSGNYHRVHNYHRYLSRSVRLRFFKMSFILCSSLRDVYLLSFLSYSSLLCGYYLYGKMRRRDEGEEQNSLKRLKNRVSYEFNQRNVVIRRSIGLIVRERCKSSLRELQCKGTIKPAF